MSASDRHVPVWVGVWRIWNSVLPGFKWPSWSAMDPRFTFSMTAPFRVDDNVLPPTIFNPNISSPSIFFLNIMWPIIRWPSADTCQLTGFCSFQIFFLFFFSSNTTLLGPEFILVLWNVFATWCVWLKFFYMEIDDKKSEKRKKSLS